MVTIIILCSLICTVTLVFICGAIAPAAPPTITIAPPSAIIEPITPPDIIEEEYENMIDGDLRSILREGVVEKSIGVMRKDGISDEAIRKKMMECFSLIDEETIDRLLK